VSLETSPSVVYDAVAVPGGEDAVQKLGNLGHALEFIKDSYRHCKPILAIGAGATLLDSAGAAASLMSGEPDPGVLTFEQGQAGEALRAFIAAIAQHRHFTREVDPPLV
jgi:catalase